LLVLASVLPRTFGDLAKVEVVGPRSASCAPAQIAVVLGEVTVDSCGAAVVSYEAAVASCEATVVL